MDQHLFLGEEHSILRDQLRRFVEERVKPNGDAWEEAGMVPRDILREMGDLGFLGVRYPETYGGSDMDTRATVVLAEELGKSTFSGFAITALVHTDMASVHIFNAGNEAQKAQYMPDIIAGRKITAVCVTEPGAGSDVQGMRSHARREGDHYILNGSKMFITNGVHADLYCVAAKTDREGPSSQSVTMFLVEKGMEGFSVSRNLDKHGWRSSDTAELSFQDVRVPVENVLGAEGQGFYAIMQNFQNERLVAAAAAVGESTAAIELTTAYVKERQAFGAPLWSKQAIRQRLAMLSARVTAARALVYQTAARDANGEDVVREVSMLKALCGELVNEVMYDCLQFHGGAGYLRGMTIERMARDARVQSIGGGATEVMLEEVAKRM
ncbi:acyl-CoA dehydrogenase family protein [Shimia thalassica]|uniref:acyl-CoA dehydrogenase family protein n=1 Tax=Shimia thalassica TaxID=1715693 RepID=UPI0026E2B041|nr:acyl-CoA dehydrogenase family protein [Shimia thalassica]MDO6520687.1 acyl-CoA dehydrogenase family protein [Shimia thalassica]MDP2495519.1 acyl-CoA dehydrogenase family protein [Shimia thalassica]MDP2519496.1 acyl-CoA dehydrogenase family protein [Shimia thalassica]